jgi:putative ABC transport system permease protein
MRELAARPGRAALAAGVVAGCVALAVGTELLARGREAAVAGEIDGIGPSLRLVPEGVTASRLARLDVGRQVLDPAARDRALRALGDRVRASEPRLVVQLGVGGVPAAVVGVPQGAPSALEPARALREGEVALGSELARRLGLPVGAPITIGDVSGRISAVLPSTASAEDLAGFAALSWLGELSGLPGAATEERLFLRPGASLDEVEARLRRVTPGVSWIREDRGEVADREVGSSLASHRAVVWAVTALVAAACLLVGAHLDAAERRVELATLVAVGASGATVLLAVVLRSLATAAAGGIAGFLLGGAVAYLVDPLSGGDLLAALPLLAIALTGAGLVGAVAAVPTAIAAARRDPVADLQDA